jgi:hypothetical protein
LYTRAWELLTEQMKKNQPEYANMSNRQIFEAVVASLTPLGGEQTPEDIGNLAMFFASDDARSGGRRGWWHQRHLTTRVMEQAVSRWRSRSACSVERRFPQTAGIPKMPTRRELVP